MSGYSSYELFAELRVAKGQLHGVLVQVFGRGVLLTGESGVGKTACAIELLRRGHTLVADDAVEIFRRGEDLVGRAPEITRSLIHIRGVGITDVTEVYHRAKILNECRIDLGVELGDPSKEARLPSFFVPFFRIGTGSPSATADRIEFAAREYDVGGIQ